MAALQTLRMLQAENRPARDDELPVLAGWSGWGAIPNLFDPKTAEHALHHERLAGLLSPADRRSAARSTLNGH